VGQHDYLPRPLGEAPHFLDCRQFPVLVQARNGVIDDDDVVSEIAPLVERREEERERQRVAVACAQSSAKGRPAGGGRSARNRHGCVVDDHVVVAGRPAPRIRGSHTVEPEASVEPL